MNQNPELVKSWITVSEELSPFAFAVIMDNDSMVSQSGSITIPEGATIVVDPEEKAYYRKNSFVLFR
ncbi:hypothetical protein QE177_08475 [Arsenophonus sp. aPb]|uniref:hypothetical protein n=1 Tax=Arsenophonus sp. aPb TaxID=3041619 RepID=UPI0024696FE1|nr:hypothetical protein [Arsenophonus sp. aPb]WGL97266.1 hypothetical protein QE177_08475 [Arsenophonus sp. aPb]